MCAEDQDLADRGPDEAIADLIAELRARCEAARAAVWAAMPLPAEEEEVHVAVAPSGGPKPGNPQESNALHGAWSHVHTV